MDEKMYLTWRDIDGDLEALAKRIRTDAGKNEPLVYGVPRGGSIIAGFLRHHGLKAVTRPEVATHFVDDIVDSGRTAKQFIAKYHKPFFGLYSKSGPAAVKGWLVFPWEGEPEKDAESIVLRHLEFIGEDPHRDGLIETPARVVKSWREIYGGYKDDPKTILAKDFDADGYDEMILLRDIEFYSTCEHHMQPFFGKAHVAYIPTKRVVGISKLARLVNCYARRLQIQERLTAQIAAAIAKHLKPRGIGVVMEARHFCMCCRGVQKGTANMVTSSMTGVFRKDAATRAEFFNLIR